METVQLQCGHCQKVMAIGVEHLGGQVQCPHCKGVVQTPPRSQPERAPAPPTMPTVDASQRESIFGEPEASDSVMGETAAPQVELPAAAAPSETAPASDVDLAKFKARPVFTKSVFAMYGLIFLVPYAILTTLVIIYLLSTQTSRHPLDMLLDPAPDGKKGGPKRTGVKWPHDHDLAAHQKGPLGQPIRVGKDGDLVVTPERVLLTKDGDLELFLRAKNISTNTVFEPMNDFWVRYDPNKAASEPYTYLEATSGSPVPIYGAYLQYRKSAREKEPAAIDGSLNAGAETTIVLTTQLEYKKSVAKIASATDTYTWRVQLRRGFVKWRGKDVSTTAVIGVEFTSAQIEKEGK